MPRALYLWGTILQEAGVGLRAGLEESGKSYPEWFEPLTIQHIANCYSGYAILA